MASQNIVFFLFSLTLLSLFNASCVSGSEIQVIEHGIRVSEFTGDVSQSTATVKGAAKNVSGWTINACRVNVTFYDYRGNIISTSSHSRQNLGPGEVWNFTVELKGADAWKVARYDISASNQ